MLHIYNRAAILEGAGDWVKQNSVKGTLFNWNDLEICRYHAEDMIKGHTISFSLLESELIPRYKAAGMLNEETAEVLKQAAKNLNENRKEAVEFAIQVFHLLAEK